MQQVATTNDQIVNREESASNRKAKGMPKSQFLFVNSKLSGLQVAQKLQNVRRSSSSRGLQVAKATSMAEDILEALAGPFERTGARRNGRVPHLSAHLSPAHPF
jgi:hypothetical protein